MRLRQKDINRLDYLLTWPGRGQKERPVAVLEVKLNDGHHI